jgi:predicted MPP superfamily phosphohydrolase
MNFRIFVFLLCLVAIDYYVYHGLRFLFNSKDTSMKAFTVIFWTLSMLTVAVILAGFFSDWRAWPKYFRLYAFSFVLILFLTKFLMGFFLLADDIIRAIRYSGSYAVRLFSQSSSDEPLRISRMKFLVQAGALFSAVPLVSLVWGMMGNAFRYKVRTVRLRLPQLPEAFEGFKAVQISDLHVGSFVSSEPIRKAIELIHAQQPDVIFFTGDLVNDRHDEALEYKELLSTLKAPMGVYSVLGNHDYGDYYRWNTMEEKEENLRKMKSLHGEMGWKLLLNNHAYLERDGHRIGLIGVENWSARMNFKRYGDMQAATDSFVPSPVNILLSHDPSHWHAEVTGNYSYVDLMLAGHTHGMQFGVEIPGFRWSPVQYVYREWADLYEQGGQYLYVNRGLGYIGYPGRVGILPEITVFEFTRG